MKAAIFAIDRLRMGTDGPGITTLVTFMGCPLHCKYCLNDQCHEPIFESDGRTLRPGIMLLTPQELYDKVKIDNIYFQATGGGVCFGGGEPGLQSEFIAEFRKISGDKWKITIETCGHYGWKHYERLAPVIDLWFLDVKAFDGLVFKDYTGEDSFSLQRLFCLKRLVNLDKVVVKVPRIPKFDDETRQEGIENLRRLGFTRIQEIDYIERIAPSTIK